MGQSNDKPKSDAKPFPLPYNETPYMMNTNAVQRNSTVTHNPYEYREYPKVNASRETIDVDSIVVTSYKMADSYARNGEYQKAHDIYLRYYDASSYYEENCKIRHNLSYCTHKMAFYNTALSYAQLNALRSYAFIYDNGKSYFRCAEALKELKRYDEAKRYYEITLKQWNDSIVKNRLDTVNALIARQTFDPIVARSNSTVTHNPYNPYEYKQYPTVSTIESRAAINKSVQNDNSGKTVSEIDKSHGVSVMTKAVNDNKGNDIKTFDSIDGPSQRSSQFTVKQNLNINKIGSSLSNGNSMNKQLKDVKQNATGDTINNTNDFNKNVDSLKRKITKDISNIDKSVGVSVKDYNSGIEIYTRMMKYNDKDHRLYINRSFYYHETGDNERALKDAATAIELQPNEAKGYFRASMALKTLERYADAEDMLKKIYVMFENDETIDNELVSIRCKALRNMGFNEELSLSFALKYKSIREANDALLADIMSGKVKITDKDENDDGDGDNDDNDVGEPTNVFALNGLKIRNVSENLSHGVLYKMFSKFGKVLKIFFDRNYNTVYVNYNDPQHPIDAVKALYGFNREGFNKNQSKPWRFGFVPSGMQRKRYETVHKNELIAKIRAAGECEDWRRSNCPLNEKCPFKHIPINQGIETLLCRKM